MNADSPEAQTPDFWNGSGFDREWLAENRSGRLADSQTGKVSPRHVLVGSFVGLVFIGSVTILSRTRNRIRFGWPYSSGEQYLPSVWPAPFFSSATCGTCLLGES